MSGAIPPHTLRHIFTNQGRKAMRETSPSRIPLPLQRGSLVPHFLPHPGPPPPPAPPHLAGGEENECLISENQATVLVCCDSRGHGQRTERDICPVLTTSSSASGWGNQRQPAGDASWGSRHSQRGHPSEPGELQPLPLLTPGPAGPQPRQGADPGLQVHSAPRSLGASLG